MEKRSYSVRQLIAIRHKAAAKKAAAKKAAQAQPTVETSNEPAPKAKRVYSERQIKAIVAKKIAKKASVVASSATAA